MLCKKKEKKRKEMVQLLWNGVWQLLKTLTIDYHRTQQFSSQVYTQEK